MLDPLDVGAEVCRDGRYALAWGVGTAYTTVWVKDASELSSKDAMTVMCDVQLQAIYWTRGFDAVIERAGVGAFDWFGAFGKFNKLTVQYEERAKSVNPTSATQRR